MSTSSEYHNATKYDPETIGNMPEVDWSAQPRPFKEFHSKTRVELRPHLLLARDEEDDRPILQQPDPTSPDYELSRLATLLLHINGVTAQQPTHDEPVFFRSAPSAGALYPTEIYVALRQVNNVEDGIYNFQVKDHTLAPVLEGDYWRDLQAHTNEPLSLGTAKIVILLSAVFLRSSWRYHDRAYRRILLDTGHVLGNLMTFGSELGYAPTTISHFNDQAIDEMMFFNKEAESTLILAALPDDTAPVEPLGVSTAITGNLVENNIQRVHQAAMITAQESPSTRPKMPEPLVGSTAQLTFALSRRPISWEDDLGPTILLRRSTRTFTGATMTSEQLGMILGFGYRGIKADKSGQFLDPARIATYLSVHRVEGLDAGLYRYDPCNSRVLLLRRGYFAREDCEIGLGQELMRDASVIVYHLADIDDAVTSTGERAYRYLNLDAGHIGQRINLAALKLDLGVSGIGGYFDDQVNELFHRPLTEGVIYATCIGQPQPQG